MEVVLGIDNLIFISILSNKLPEHQRQRARRIGIGLALVMRLVLLSTIAWIVGLTAPVFDLGLAGAARRAWRAGFETAFSWRDLILIAGGLFLVWKATKEIHHNVDPGAERRRVRHDAQVDAQLRRGDRPDPAARPRLLDRFDPDRGRHDRASADHGRRGDRRGRR